MSLAPVAERALADGDPDAALIALQEAVKAKPADAKLRIFLFQLLCVLGRWERDDDYEARLKRVKAARDTIAQERDLRQGIVCPNHVLATIARTLPGDPAALATIPGLRPWQVREFGEALLNALK